MSERLWRESASFFVQHKQTFVLPALSLPMGSIKVELISDKCIVFNEL